MSDPLFPARPEEDVSSWDGDAFEDDSGRHADAEPTAPTIDAPPALLPWSWRDGGRAPRWPRVTAASAAAWSAYYKGLYTVRGPDPALFERLLHRYGAWNLPNPMPEGHRDRSLWCADGVLLADVDFVLDDWMARVQRGPRRHRSPASQTYPAPTVGPDWKQAHERVNADLRGRWLALSDRWAHLFRMFPAAAPDASVQSVAAQAAAVDRRRRAQWRADALVCLTRLFLLPDTQWAWMSESLHPDNRDLLCRLVHEAAPRDGRTRPALRAGWCGAGWLTASDLTHFSSADDSL